ncbi:MAG: geranylgeranylglycerol-phosphate geranylgeranyltransferase [Candidatus Diapherotrites archaeon]|nr:geranylgeranylglycerol-phosphate geranylgeranyltransferase [Candidatus Diapherotrites archaeon]
MALRDYLALLRPLNCLMAGVSALIGAFLGNGVFFSVELGFVFLSVFLICGAGQAINDVYDYETDRKTHSDRSIAGGRITQQQGMLLSGVLFLAGLAFAWLINLNAFSIALLFVFLLNFYAQSMKKSKPLGNLVVSAGTAAPLVFGATLHGNYALPLLLAGSAFFANYARELIKDFEDLAQDQGHKRTLPMRYPRLSKYLCTASNGMAIGLGWVPFLNGSITTPAYAFFLIVSGGILLFSLYLLSRNRFRQSQQASKSGMLIALLAFLSAAIG